MKIRHALIAVFVLAAVGAGFLWVNRDKRADIHAKQDQLYACWDLAKVDGNIDPKTMRTCDKIESDLLEMEARDKAKRQ